MNIDLSGMRVLVTGASRGIGRAIAEEMIRSGAVVGVHFHRNREAAESVAGLAEGRAKALHADLSDAAACAGLFQQAVDLLGGVDVLVNNAGVALSSPLDEPLEDCTAAWNRTLAVNLVAAGILCRESIRHFEQRGGGRIINIASRAAFDSRSVAAPNRSSRVDTSVSCPQRPMNCSTAARTWRMKSGTVNLPDYSFCVFLIRFCYNFNFFRHHK